MKPSANKIMILIAVILMDLLAGMEFDLFVPSFPELQKEFSLSPFWVEALLSVNFMGFCLSLFFVGALADHYGRKPIIILGLLIFSLGSVLCLGKTYYMLLIMGRLLQGIGIAAPSILSFLIIADTYPIKQQQYLLALLNGVMNLAIALAPVIGSYITLYCHWQGNFRALLGLGIIVLIVTWFFIPMTHLPQQKEVLSVQGYKPIFKSKILLLLMGCLVTSFVPYWVFVGISPLLYMEDLGVSLSHFGYYQGVLALIFAIGSVLYGLFMDKYDQKKMLYLSCLAKVCSLIMIVLIAFYPTTNPLLITLAFAPFVVGQIVPTTLIFPLCLNYIPQTKGKVAAVIQGSRLILSAMSLQLAGWCYVGSFQNIGIIISVFILMAVVTLLLALKKSRPMEC